MTNTNFRNALSVVLLAFVVLTSSGCSSLGLSLFPTGHYLTEQSEAVLNCSPRAVDLPRELDMNVVPAHYLQPGDVLLIEPVDLESNVRIPADQKVMADGSIDLSKYGRVIVAGLTLESAEHLVEQTIVDGGDKPTQINVRLLEPVHRYYVLGEVNSPGSYPLEGQETVLDGLLAAGGLTTAAAPCKILLARPTQPDSCRVTLPVCYREITQLGDTTTNYQLRPGDRIFVATRTCCEDLMFWEASATCQRCCKFQTACPDPNMAPFVNPMSRVAGDSVPNTVSPTKVRPPAGDSRGSGPEPIAPPAETSELEKSHLESKRKWMDAQAGGTEPATDLESDDSGDSSLPSPQRLPTADGELDFDDIESGPSSADRFEPLWITPPAQAE